MDVIERRHRRARRAGCGRRCPTALLRSLLVDGVIAGVGGVLVFLPQILILFFFILLLEDRGYLPRAAFLLDRLMGSVGLSGRAFIPLLSSFACAIPGIMATRTIAEPARPAGHHHDRAADDLLGAAAGVCAADRRLHPGAQRSGLFNLQGLVLFGCTSPASSARWRVAWVLKRFTHARPATHAADDGAAELPLAEPAQPRDRPVGARAHLPDARRHASSSR